MTEPTELMPLEEAQARILEAVAPLAEETVPLIDALDRFSVDEVRAPIDLPPFDNSSMDGYAVRADDLRETLQGRPVTLKCVGQLAAGQPSHLRVEPGTCVRVFTGSALPEGADTVVMQEHTEADASGSVTFLRPAKPFDHIRRRGDDVRRGSVVLQAGDRISVVRLALLAALGIGALRVRRRPSVAILSTGSELRSAGESLAPGQIYESNQVMLTALLHQSGAQPVPQPPVPDDPDATRRALSNALDQAEWVITTGGVSVGPLDLVRRCFEELGGRLSFWRVAIRPGKPFTFGRWKEKYFFGLPGNPVSAFVTFLLLVRPALRRMLGAANVELPGERGVLAEPLMNRGDRRHFMRVHVNEAGQVRPVSGQGSHQIGALARANGLVEVPAHGELDAGTPVRVLRWDLD